MEKWHIGLVFMTIFLYSMGIRGSFSTNIDCINKLNKSKLWAWVQISNLIFFLNVVSNLTSPTVLRFALI